MAEKRWWLIGVAAAMAALFLYQSIGSAGVVAIAGALGIFWVFRRYWPARKPAVRCLTCGEALSDTARSCKYCGSARWTVN